MKKLFILFIVLGTVISHGSAQDFKWAKQFDGETKSTTTLIEISLNGNMFISGTFEGTIDFDGGEGTEFLTSKGESDLFIEKTDLNGNLIWVKQIGGTGDEFIRGMSIDSEENIYLTGSFKGTTDLDPGDEEVNYTSAGGWDIYLLELDKDGNYKWSGQIGSPLEDYGVNIEVPSSGNIYVSGYFAGTADFDPSDDSEYFLTASYQALFVEKFSSTKELQWAGVMGGPGIDYLQDMCIDDEENVYTTGGFAGPADFDPGEGTAILNSVGDRDVYVSKLNSNGEYVWAVPMGGPYVEFGQGIDVDTDGNVYLAGNFAGTVDFDPSSDTEYYLTSLGDNDIFMGKLNADAELLWMKQIGASGNQSPYRLTLDEEKNVYSTGYFEETVDFNPGDEEYLLTSAGNIDIYINKLNSMGDFVWAVGMGGDGDDRGLTLFTRDNHIYTGGLFTGTVDFDPGDESFILSGTGDYNGFIIKTETTLLGTDEHFNDNNIIVYPNPTNACVNIDFNRNITSGEINVYSILGENIFAKNINNQHFVKLDLKENKGIFFIKISSSENAERTIKLIKY